MTIKNRINDKPSLAQKYRKILQDQVIDGNDPGTILHDFDILLHHVISGGIAASGKHHLFDWRSVLQARYGCDLLV